MKLLTQVVPWDFLLKSWKLSAEQLQSLCRKDDITPYCIIRKFTDKTSGKPVYECSQCVGDELADLVNKSSREFVPIYFDHNEVELRNNEDRFVEYPAEEINHNDIIFEAVANGDKHMITEQHSENVTRSELSKRAKSWEQIEMTIISDHVIEIMECGEKRNCEISEIGLSDARNRIEPKPTKIFSLLGIFATLGGDVDERKLKYAEKSSQAKFDQKAVSDLRKKLKAMFPQIKDDPFFPYRKTNSYRLRFRIFSRNSSDQN